MMAEAAANGCCIVVVGPSGAGKDSVMNAAAEQLKDNPHIHFVRRVITRPPDGVGEDHDSIGRESFNMLQDAGAFAVAWEAHGLKYGIPAETMLRVQAGDTIVVNGSRAALPAFLSAYASVRVALITASPDVLAQRLLARGRETTEDIQARLARPAPPIQYDVDVTQIDNSGPLHHARDQLIALITA